VVTKFDNHANVRPDRSRLPAKAGQLASLFHNAMLGVAITNAAFRFLTANPAMLKMLGYSIFELRLQWSPTLRRLDQRWGVL
jgi:PAS domain-containing protein